MSIFRGSSHFTIEGGTFSSVGRDQFNITECSHRDDRVWTVLDEYQRIPTGKVYLKRQITKADVKIRSKREWRNIDACRTIHTARIRGEDKDEEFLHVQYSGHDASKAFKLDFDTFSAIKDTNCLQLFGYSKSTIPALVFYDALVPVSHIWERNNFSPLLYTYFCYQAVVVQGFDYGISSQELWFDPETGFLRKGPFVRYSSNTDYQLANLATVLPDVGRSSLTLPTYSDTNVLFEYLNETLSISDIIRGIRMTAKAFIDYPNEEDAKWILSSLPGTIYHRASWEIIARYPEDRGMWYHEFREGMSTIPDALQGCVLTMYDGSVRFTLKSSDMGDLESLELFHDLRPWNTWNDFVDSWLSQACGILSQLGEGEDDFQGYSTILGFWLHFEHVGEHETSHTYMDLPEETPIYLFIRPIPRPYDDEDRWDFWLRDAKYYWSLDSSGVDEMSEHEQLNLGLPAFTTEIEVCHVCWARETYDIVKMIHRSQGFEPTSTELATSLGHPILEFAGRMPRFEEVDDDDRSSNSDSDEYMTAEESFCEDSDPDTVDTDHDEVVLYPRLNLCRSVTGR